MQGVLALSRREAESQFCLLRTTSCVFTDLGHWVWVWVWTDLEGGAVLGNFHDELVGDGGSALLQGDQAEVSQAGSV